MPMRRLLLTLLCGLIVVPAAYGARRAAGDGVLELKDVYGFVQIGSDDQPAQGALWGQMDSGRLVVVDPVQGDGQIYVSGWDTRTPTNDVPRTIVYKGTNLHFRVTGGKYKLVFNGTGIDLTAVGIGVARLDGSSDVTDPGSYALDSGNWIPMPVLLAPRQTKAVTFGDLTALTP